MPSAAHRAGKIVAERYQLLEEIGTGGMGAVWRARSIVDGAIVALKLLHGDSRDEDDARERFLREARALHALRSPHIVAVFDSGIDRGTPFIAMELLSGETLADRLRRDTRLGPRETREIIRQTALGVAAAHDLGIVHRDLKPDNIFLPAGAEAAVKLLDFGVAKTSAADTALRTLTRTGMAIGTPHYMSPEQIEGGELDARTDVWSLTVITYECILGARPFTGGSIAKLCMAICEDPLPVPSALRPVPPGFDAWFARGVARQRDERFPGVRALADALDAILDDVGETVAPVVSAEPVTYTLMQLQLEDEPRLMQHAGPDFPALRDRLAALAAELATPAGAMAIQPGATYAFRGTAGALEVAIAFQQRVRVEHWPGGYQVRVGIALGEARVALTASGVDDAALERTRALGAVSHGGQILVGPTVAARIPRAANGIRLADLGEHEIDEDLRQRVFQVVAPGLNVHVAPLRTRHGPPNNLPDETSEFFGREADLAALDQLCRGHRLVTLRGSGGVGKSRLAVRVAARRAGEMPDGVFLVPLSGVRKAELVLPTLASVLGVAEERGRTTLEALGDFLAERQLLVVLDNFEQVLDAAGDVERLLAAGPALSLVVTSRTALGLVSEAVYDVGPLDPPPAEGTAETLGRNHAVQLLIDRARRANPEFLPAPELTPTLAEICRKLEGLPLAIELAAARLDELSPAELLRQLSGRQTSLQDWSGEVARRHRTLGEVVAWSYQLLDPELQRLLRRLAVFAGGFSRALAERVAGEGLAIGLERGITALIGSSLLRRDPQARLARFTMLESIREFAVGELDKSDEHAALRRRHAIVIADVVKELAPSLRREGSVEARDRLALEDGNLRAALDHCLQIRDGELGVTLASSAWRYWQSAGRLQEGRRWLVELLACPGVTLATRARGLDALGGLAYWQGDYAAAASRYREALDIHRDLGDRVAVGEMLFALSTTATWSGDSARGEALAQEALSIFEEMGAREQVGMVRMAQGFARWMQRDLAGARPLWESSIEIAREVGDRVEAAHKTLALAAITFAEGRENDAIVQAVHAMDELFEHHNVALTVMAIDFLAAMAVTRDPARAARLAGAAAKLRGTMGGGMRPEACGLPSVAGVATGALGAPAFQQELAQGSRLTLGEALDLARALSTITQG